MSHDFFLKRDASENFYHVVCMRRTYILGVNKNDDDNEMMMMMIVVNDDTNF